MLLGIGGTNAQTKRARNRALPHDSTLHFEDVEVDAPQDYCTSLRRKPHSCTTRPYVRRPSGTRVLGSLRTLGLPVEGVSVRLLDGVAQAVDRDSVLIYVLHACRAGSHYRRVHVCIYIYIQLFTHMYISLHRYISIHEIYAQHKYHYKYITTHKQI